MIECYIRSHDFSVSARKTKRHGTVYDVRFRAYGLDGKEHNKRLSGFATRTAAKAGYTKWISEHAEFIDALPRREQAPASAPTVGALIAEYTMSLGGINKDSVIYDKRNVYDLFVLPRWRATPITELTADELRAWQRDLLSARNPRTGEPYTRRYIVKIRGFLSSFLRWASEVYGYQNHLPEVAQPQRTDTQKERTIWTPEDFDRFISVVDDPMWRTFFIFAFYTGRRLGELLALSPEDVTDSRIHWTKSLTKKTLEHHPDGRYAITSTKAHKEASLPYSDKVREAIRTYTPGTPFYFGGERPLSETHVSYMFHKFSDAAGLPRIRFHDLRHSLASLLLHNGENMFVVAQLLSDTPEQIAKTYGHAYADDITDAVSKL